MSKFHPIKIQKIQRETPSSVSIVFEIPDSLKKDFQFIPGQYLNVKKELNGEELRRAYSICSSINNPEVSIAVKEVEGGRFSVFSNRDLKEGDTLFVSLPEGKFNLNPDPDNQKNYMAFAAGSGITPVFSMIQSVLEIEPKSTFVLIFGNKRVEETMFKQQIDQLVRKFPNNFLVHYVFSQKQEVNSHFGRMTEAYVENMIQTCQSKIPIDDVFICGPEGMIDLVENKLRETGIEANKIHVELFTTSDSGTEKESAQSLEGEAEITVVLDDDTTTFVMKSKSSILTAALLNGLDAPYSCQGGICSSCLARITDGKVIMDNNRILSQEELDEGLILTCQSHPVTPKVTIDYDDV